MREKIDIELGILCFDFEEGGGPIAPLSRHPLSRNYDQFPAMLDVSLWFLTVAPRAVTSTVCATAQHLTSLFVNRFVLVHSCTVNHPSFPRIDYVSPPPSHPTFPTIRLIYAFHRPIYINSVL